MAFKRFFIDASERPQIISLSETISDNAGEGSSHRHSHAEILLVCEGRGAVKSGGDKYLVAKGDIVIINPMTAHTEFNSGGIFRYCVISVKNLGFDFGSGGIEVVSTCAELQAKKNAFVREIGAIMQEGEALDNFAVLSKIYSLLSFLKKNLEVLTGTAAEEKLSVAALAKNYIKNNYGANFSVAGLAKKLFISPNYLIRSFKKELGITPVQYLNSLRLKHACYILKNSDLSVTQVGYQVGFSSTAYFIKIFKNKYNTTPAAYRKTAVK